MNNQNENKNKNPELPEETAEERKAKINRIVYITAIVLLISIAIIAGIVSAANRAKKDPVETPAATTEKTPSTSAPKASESPSETSAPDSSSADSVSESVGEEDVVSAIPEFALPVKGSVSVYHDPDIQVFSPTMKDYRVHLGVDINASAGASVSAAADGVIEKVWEDPLMGTCVAIAHDGDATTYYKNLSETLAEGIKKGATVTSGQLIGTVGDTAMVEVAQDPHLHFEITVGGEQVDPSEYFSDEVWAELDTDTDYEG